MQACCCMLVQDQQCTCPAILDIGEYSLQQSPRFKMRTWTMQYSPFRYTLHHGFILFVSEQSRQVKDQTLNPEMVWMGSAEPMKSGRLQYLRVWEQYPLGNRTADLLPSTALLAANPHCFVDCSAWKPTIGSSVPMTPSSTKRNKIYEDIGCSWQLVYQLLTCSQENC